MKNGILAGVVAVTFALPMISFAADAPAGEPAKTPVAEKGAAKEKAPAQAHKSKAEKAPDAKKATE